MLDIMSTITKQYDSARELFEVFEQGDTIDKDDCYDILITCNRANRAELLLEMIQTLYMSNETINELIRYVWTDTENAWDCREEWEELWNNYYDPFNEKLCDRLFKEPRILYRGGCAKGQSWTFKKSIAKFFIMRRMQDKTLQEKIVERDDVIAVFNNRKEQEVILKVDNW